MYCGNCGAQNSDTAKFCSNCGAPIQSVNAGNYSNRNQGGYQQNTNQQGAYQQNGYQQNANQQNAYQQNAYQQGGYQQNAYQQNAYQQGGYQQNAYQQNAYRQGGGYNRPAYGSKKSFSETLSRFAKNKKAVAIAAAALVVIIVIIIVMCSAYGKKTLKVEDYLEVTFEGTDGDGSISITGRYDWEYDAYEIVEKKYRNNESKLWNSYWLIEDIYVYVEADQEYGLSNGDTVTLTITVDDDGCESLPFKVKGGKIKVKVTGLEE